MGLLRKGISIVEFDETYFAQERLQRLPHEDIDVRQIHHVNLFCEDHALSQLSSELGKRSQKGITFIGSGNYHYLTYLLLKEIWEPFSMVLFDNHPDLELNPDRGESVLSCGSWVSHALRDISLLKQVVIIGPTAELEHHVHHPRVILFPFNGRHQYSLKAILSVIHTQNVYISIDKDVLNTAEASTNWDQGVMSLADLTHYLEMILKYKKAQGIDICGEASISPVDLLVPRYQSIIQKNERANLQILQTCLKGTQIQTRSA
ncbi:arginase family protein [Bacillus sp. BRMEA1]|uniref:arginase family protein n=1 Tax=Neobacillus endophyticus TaxID=2738405 RepID=UPI0015659931|nr:arginase family protein [Neobacillus endophyticus]NRD78186.1 arginase family protein [Neobacillus endophyticus]